MIATLNRLTELGGAAQPALGRSRGGLLLSMGEAGVAIFSKQTHELDEFR
jgi:hypothetical protein